MSSHVRTSTLWVGVVPLPALVLACGNYSTKPQPNLNGQAIAVTFLHTTDIHSRIFPYRMKVAYTDRQLGLKDDNGPFGGAARIAHIVKTERSKAERSLYLDSGDFFQGAPIFNFFHGEPEVRALSMMGVDAVASGNHDFDQGEANLAQQIAAWATFPYLAANYYVAALESSTPPPLQGHLGEYQIFNLRGFRIGVIGLGNTSSLTTVVAGGNKLGITPLQAFETAQNLVDALSPLVGVIVVLSHLGLTEDQELIQWTTGIDIVFGGHHHVVLNPPKVVKDCQIQLMDPDYRERFLKRHANCKPRDVILVHSGAFAKYVGKLVAVFEQAENADGQPTNNWEVVYHDYTPIPVDRTVPEDQLVAEMLEPYRDKLNQLLNLRLPLAYAPKQIGRFGTMGGDSQLGSLVAEAMRRRQGVETDFALTNTLGIRTDIFPGPVTVDDMFNVFPFENTITKMYLSGTEVIRMFDYVARRSAVRGCKSQAQIAGARVVLKCGECDVTRRPADWPAPEAANLGCAYSIEVLGQPVQINASYQVAVNNYIASGGSGFTVLKENTTKIDTGIPLRDAVMDLMRSAPPCALEKTCTTDADCGSEAYVCGCKARVAFTEDKGSCESPGQCPGHSGKCVLKKCVDDMAAFMAEECPGANSLQGLGRCQCSRLEQAYQLCADLACLDERASALEDGRITMVQP